MNTRIKKFSVLRNKVEQEIKTLKLQEDNLKKIKEYKAKINGINAKIFGQSNKIASKTFPDLTSLIHVERENARTDLKRIQEEVTK
ncbi:MAG: hypothetical protein QJQ54_02385 [Mollicutes bacterium]|nr:MAG: hypothetical protein QJQ54_02385 [Mollicutes bacterium]